MARRPTRVHCRPSPRNVTTNPRRMLCCLPLSPLRQPQPPLVCPKKVFASAPRSLQKREVSWLQTRLHTIVRTWQLRLNGSRWSLAASVGEGIHAVMQLPPGSVTHSRLVARRSPAAVSKMLLLKTAAGNRLPLVVPNEAYPVLSSKR